MDKFPLTGHVMFFIVLHNIVMHTGFELTDSESRFAIRFRDFATHFAMK
jgi:hypothetical protein